MPTILSGYLNEISRISATGAGTAETSYYGALQGAFNAVGDALRPRVFCVPQLANRRGAGFPDFGLFPINQVGRRGRQMEWPDGALPERGVVEADDIPAALAIKRKSRQVRDYLGAYGLVLITNFRDFELLERRPNGGIRQAESFSFGLDVNGFFEWAANARGAADDATGVRFVEFLQRVMLFRAPLAEPRDVAFFLASYARDGLARVESQAELPALAALKDALGASLGMTFDGARGDHLFRSTLVQTLFYGLFSAWATHARAGGGEFNWHAAEWSLHVPMVRALFEQIATPARLRPLGLIEVLDWAGVALNRIDTAAFFAHFDDAQAVQYFYEPFLEAFDPELRRELGVWYTPPEIVEYMVERIDRVLRTELGLADGLADRNVWVLDPCCGTGSYLVAVLRRIARTLAEQGGDAALGMELKDAAMRRVAGFEIMPAPFVIAHWQIGTFLRIAGAPLDDDTDERAAVYLTNALTGWDAAGPQGHLPFPELETERDLAQDIKRVQPILVVLGNPPYNAFAGTSPQEERGLVDPYKDGLLRDWHIRKYNLDDLYIRFFRIAERRIAEQTGRGIICYISNFSYLRGPSYVVMRRRLLERFDRIWIDCLNGDSRETGKLTPDGRPDPSVFSTDTNREGIRVGTSISLLLRHTDSAGSQDVNFRQFWGETKRADLVASLDTETAAFEHTYDVARPTRENRYAFRPALAAGAYPSWPRVVELCAAEPISGLQEMRRGQLMSVDREELQRRFERYADPAVTWEQVVVEHLGPTAAAGRFDPIRARNRILADAEGHPTMRRYALHPYDHMWCAWSKVRPLWNEPRPELAQHVDGTNRLFITRTIAERPHENVPAFMTSALPDYHLLRPNIIAIPLRLAPPNEGNQGDLLHVDTWRPNLSAGARDYVAALGLRDPDEDQASAEAVWYHALAITFTPAWIAEHGEAIRQNWPRVPLPVRAELLWTSERLGRAIADLLDPDIAVEGVTSGNIRPELREIAPLSKLGGGNVGPDDLTISVAWGILQRDNVIMPGQGQLTERDYSAAEVSTAARAEILGNRTFDVFLNDHVYWRNVPAAVWNFTIGGYQVIKKWLSYRERAILGRPLTLTEARHFRDTARRLAALALMTQDLQANYAACSREPYEWESEAE